ncbi:MAG: bifunctional (p)ppGpp synthetase/guanosine-3',5'-bis(diphosphate) 3'-pyrophosphohydrolase [Acetobacteraceae bacterium]|nr:bifunctional (p)ppGpp synthetase/guanosine-3',5'-bis(diphosphate) 3'-pyrophosphohydrolase [Acetobacteraceae bacterium]
MSGLRLEELKELVKASSPEGDLGLIERAYRFSRLAHQGQYRVSGEDFIQHPVAVAAVLAELGLDVTTVAAGLLHDVVEDTGVTLKEIEAEFGPEMGRLVDGVTKLSRLEYRSREEEQAENLRKMFLAMARDIRVIIIKLADRLHNLRTLRHLDPEKRREIARETLDVFAPLAHRLGIFRFKWELEDLALYHLEPEIYRDLVEKVAKKREEREAYTAQVIARIRGRLEEAGIKADIQGRPKHFYSIYKKMYQQGKDFSEIYDLTAVRVIVETVRDCYAALGIIHTLWKPIPGRFKDFIAMPKPNMYQSLHTTLVGPDGEPFEVQIRTPEMHRTAEYGIAAHWRYKEGGRTDPKLDQKLFWLRQAIELESEARDPKEFMEQLRMDVFAEDVFVFTPKGDVVDLPAGSCPIDFAYRIHTDVGHRCIGARVNGKLAPLGYTLKTGDIVEIITAKAGAGPSWDWIALVRTSLARNRIRQWFKKERREEYIAEGRKTLEREARRQGLDLAQLWDPVWVQEVAARFNCPSEEELLLAVGCGGLSGQQVVNRLREALRRRAAERQQAAVLEEALQAPPLEGPAEPRAAPGGQVVQVEGVENPLVRLARCCNPIPGDAILGFVTRGRGVSVHRRECPNVAQFRSEPERLIGVTWGRPERAVFLGEVEVVALDREGLLSDVAQVVAQNHTNIVSVKAPPPRAGKASIDMVLEIGSLDQLSRICQGLAQVRGVLDVRRVKRSGRQGGARRAGAG